LLSAALSFKVGNIRGNILF